MEDIVNSLPCGTVLRGKAFKYSIEKVLGQGSFGITYLATVPMEGALGAIEANVAVKEFFMRDINGRDGSSVTNGSQHGLCEDYKRKFFREARNLSRLKHNNIVRVVEAFEANGTVYYAMEYISGGSLDSYILSHGRLRELECVRFAQQICSALQFMHQNGMLHLDLKPLNIMLRKGEAVLIDFGLSKQYNEKGEPESSTTVGRGTPGYAPLEQADYQDGKGFPVTMDVYALGATMFKMLTGHTPPNASEVFNQGFPSGELQELGVSPWLIQLIEKCMEPAMGKRPQSAAEVLKALNQHAPTGEETVVDGGVAGGGMPEKPQGTTGMDDEPDWGRVTEPGDTGEESGATLPPSKSNNVKWIAVGLVAVCIIGIIIAARLVNGDSTKTRESYTSYSQQGYDYDATEVEAVEEAPEEEIVVADTRQTQSASTQPSKPANGYINGHEYVDLGLSVKWATCNVGASSPEGYGNYYAWGETSPKSSYDEDNCKTYNVSMGSIAGNSSYDAARANWGGTWRLPTASEIDELINKCQRTWTTMGGHNGYKVTGPSGNSIFLPTAVCRYGTSLDNAGDYGNYWSATPYGSSTQDSYCLYFGSGYFVQNYYDRHTGRSVRPVSE